MWRPRRSTGAFLPKLIFSQTHLLGRALPSLVHIVCRWVSNGRSTSGFGKVEQFGAARPWTNGGPAGQWRRGDRRHHGEANTLPLGGSSPDGLPPSIC